MSGDAADGWVLAPDGRRFWGKAGAAGLVVVDGDRVLLQHRAEWSHFGGTWGIPGGARHFGETAVQGALRESAEEAGVPAEALRLLFSSEVDLGFWSYTTVVARVTTPFAATISDHESQALAWVPLHEVGGLPLHPGFAASWPRLLSLLQRPLRLIVDAANVVGSRPDGWWRDRAGASERLIAGLVALAEAGVRPGDLLGHRSQPDPDPGPDSTDWAGEVWWPDLDVVLEGQGRGAQGPVAHSRVSLHRASADGDAAIVDRVAAQAPAARVVVVTADRELARRVEALGALVVRPRALLALLPD